MKNLTEHETIAILDIYRSQEEEQLRPQLAGYHLVNYEGIEYFASTDAHRLILIPKNETKIEFNSHERRINIESILIPFSIFETSLIIDPERILELYKSIPMVPESIKCESCNGEGEFDHYSESYECKRCDGDGFYESHYSKVHDPDSLIKIKNTLLSSDFLMDVRKVSLIVEETEFAVLYSADQRIVIKIGEIITVIMAKKETEKTTVLKY